MLPAAHVQRSRVRRPSKPDPELELASQKGSTLKEALPREKQTLAQVPFLLN